MKFKIYIQALRLPFSISTLLTYILLWLSLGLKFNFLFFFSAFALIITHLSANLWNDYFDQRADSNNHSPTAFSGGSRMIQKKHISSKSFFYYALALSSFSALSAVVLMILSAKPLQLFFILAAVSFLAFFYTAPPFRFVYRGLGEIAIFLTFGPLIFFGLLFFTGISFQNPAFLISCLMGVLTSRILFVNEIPDYESDKISSKNNWVVLLGVKNSKRVSILFSVLAAVFAFCLFRLPFFILYCILLFILEFFSFFSKKHEQRSALGLLEVFCSGIFILIYLLLF